ncbi:diaminopropionate ammonia-lyase [Bacillus piscicola]|uniref:diaminopropionate ammonia-lyase n=1 Tax=Bacillus piscicola TaxID=1632684 RepID=UPI001F08B35A|nr:diaminopropionate ammonia-lyase [Bacillus piscicola]
MDTLADNRSKGILNKAYKPVYNEEELAFFSPENINEVLTFQQSHPLYTNTPLYSLKNLAAYLQVADIKVKDESQRFGLNAFKIMGGIYAVGKYIAKKLDRDIADLTFSELQSPEMKEQIGDVTFITATDGNHGRGIAWAARELGQKSVVYMPKGSSATRLEAIQQEGAFAEITDLNYDDTIRMCSTLAEDNGWVLVQDTAWEGYEEIPLWIMQGYSAIAAEIVEKLESDEEKAPTHIFLQAGVGSFAAGIAAYFTQYYRDNPPIIVVVEPDLADCYYRSFANPDGEMEFVTGHMNSIMAGLCCGEPNNRAFRILKQYAYASYSCADPIAALGMRVLGNPLSTDPKIISGESGAVPLGLLFFLRAYEENAACQNLKLDENANVLVLNTEGDTNHEHYLDIVWKGHYPND